VHISSYNTVIHNHNYRNH